MKSIIIIAVFTTASVSNAQEHKTYSGKYSLGNATYTYYEKEGLGDTRVLDGKFSYKDKSYEVEGNFKSNIRDGEWTYTVYDWNHEALVHHKYVLDAKEIVKAKYIDGVREGHWEITRNGSTRLSVNFKNGFLHGPVIITKNYGEDKFNIRGEYNQGKRTGVWECNFENGDIIHVVCHGVSRVSPDDDYLEYDTTYYEGNYEYTNSTGYKKKATGKSLFVRVWGVGASHNFYEREGTFMQLFPYPSIRKVEVERPPKVIKNNSEEVALSQKINQRTTISQTPAQQKTSPQSTQKGFKAKFKNYLMGIPKVK